MGVRPARLPGSVALADADGRARLEAAWGASLPAADGLSIDEMVTAMENGDLTALYVGEPTRPSLWPTREVYAPPWTKSAFSSSRTVS